MQGCAFLVCLDRLWYYVPFNWKRKENSIEYLVKISGGNREIHQTFVRIKTFKVRHQDYTEFRCPHVWCFMSPYTGKWLPEVFALSVESYYWPMPFNKGCSRATYPSNIDAELYLVKEHIIERTIHHCD